MGDFPDLVFRLEPMFLLLMPDRIDLGELSDVLLPRLNEEVLFERFCETLLEDGVNDRLLERLVELLLPIDRRDELLPNDRPDALPPKERREELPPDERPPDERPRALAELIWLAKVSATAAMTMVLLRVFILVSLWLEELVMFVRLYKAKRETRRSVTGGWRKGRKSGCHVTCYTHACYEI